MRSKKSGLSDETLDEVSGNMVNEFLLILRCGALNTLRWVEVDDVLFHWHVELVQWEYINELVRLRSNVYRAVVGLRNEGKLVGSQLFGMSTPPHLLMKEGRCIQC